MVSKTCTITRIKEKRLKLLKSSVADTFRFVQMHKTNALRRR